MGVSARHQPGIGKPAVALLQPGATWAPPVSPTGAATATAEAIRELWHLHGAALTRFALKLTLGDRQRAEDIVQETLLRAWRHPEVVDGREKIVRPWLFTVTRHVAIDMWRTRSPADEVIDSEQTDLPDPAQSIEQAAAALDVRAAIAQLTPEHRQVIVEMYYLGRSVTEIAQSLRIPEGTVKSRAYYGIRHLRRLLSAVSGEMAEDAASALPRQPYVDSLGQPCGIPRHAARPVSPTSCPAARLFHVEIVRHVIFLGGAMYPQRHRRAGFPRPRTLLEFLGAVLAVTLAVVAVLPLASSAKPAGTGRASALSDTADSPSQKPEPSQTEPPRTEPPRTRLPKPRPSRRSHPQPTAKALSAHGSSTAPAKPSSPVASAPPGPAELSLAAYLDNIGATDDSQPGAGNLDGSTSSFSVQALAAQGVTSGTRITYSGVPFIWPDAAAAKADNVTASGQTLTLHGSGQSISFLLTAGWGPASGTGTLVYANGSTQTFTLGAPDWYTGCSSAKPPGTVISMPYRNQGNGRASFTVCVYNTSVGLHAGQPLNRIILPNISPPVPQSGEPSLHIFAITIH
jgi:RNA polymerase sigma-70 factor, ECF subfamily